MCVWTDIDYIGSDIWWHCKQYARTMNIAIRLFRHWAHGSFRQLAPVPTSMSLFGTLIPYHHLTHIPSDRNIWWQVATHLANTHTQHTIFQKQYSAHSFLNGALIAITQSIVSLLLLLLLLFIFGSLCICVAAAVCIYRNSLSYRHNNIACLPTRFKTWYFYFMYAFSHFGFCFRLFW